MNKKRSKSMMRKKIMTGGEDEGYNYQETTNYAPTVLPLQYPTNS